MTRTIQADMLTALTGDSVEIFLAVEAEFDSGTVRLWTGYHDVMIDGQTYTGAGHLLDISGMEEVGDMSAQGVTVTLSGAITSIVSLALQEPYQGRPARVLFGVRNATTTTSPYELEGVTPTLVFDPAAGVIGSRTLGPEDYVRNGTSATLIFDPASGFSGTYDTTFDTEVDLGPHFIEAFAGIVDVMSITTGPSNASITMTIESKYVSLQRPNTRRYTPENHKLRHSNDTFFDYTASLQDKEIVWGRKVV